MAYTLCRANTNMTSPSVSTQRYVSQKASRFTESVIREMTREALKHGAVNLSQGFPDFSAPADIKRAASEAIAADINQYAITWGARDFREAIADKTRWHLGLEIDPETAATKFWGDEQKKKKKKKKGHQLFSRGKIRQKISAPPPEQILRAPLYKTKHFNTTQWAYDSIIIGLKFLCRKCFSSGNGGSRHDNPFQDK